MADDKTAKEYNIEGGSVLHLVRVPLCIRRMMKQRGQLCHFRG